MGGQRGKIGFFLNHRDLSLFRQERQWSTAKGRCAWHAKVYWNFVALVEVFRLLLSRDCWGPCSMSSVGCCVLADVGS